jgi:hypothetical protein
VTHRRRTTPEELEERLLDTERSILRARSYSEVQARLAKKYGVDGRTVRTWIKKARQRWRDRSTEDDRPMMRDEVREKFRDVYALALAKNVVVKNPDGTVAFDAQGEPVRQPTPDLRAALHAARELVHLDGLAEPVRAEVKLEADVSSAPDLAALTTEQRAALDAYLKTLAPGGDVSALAGETFRLSGSES